MNNRILLQSNFLNDCGWANADLILLMGDASSRAYSRLIRDDDTSAILMNVPPPSAELIKRFCDVAEYLNQIGISAPEVYHRTEEDGFLLIEDFGDALLSDILKISPSAEMSYYIRITDLLLHLHSMPLMNGLDKYGPDEMGDFIGILFDSYVTPLTGQDDPDLKCRAQRLMQEALEQYAPETNVVILRDFHADNILHLPDRGGMPSLGMLDFQDALYGHRAYDLVSLLEDARRDVSKDVKMACISHYIEHSGCSAEAFQNAFTVQGAQRNLRIMGIFANLANQHGKVQYLDLLPRVWTHIINDLQSPILTNLRTLVLDEVPAPTPEILNRLKLLCLTP
ncbi:MAG: phosphotransferase [Pseudoruegeria sp.]